MEIQDMIRQKQDSGDLKVIELPGKGKGVVAGRMFTKGEYVCEYAGDLIEKTEADKREQQYLEEANRHQMDEMMCYMYFLKHRGKIWWYVAKEKKHEQGQVFATMAVALTLASRGGK